MNKKLLISIFVVSSLFLGTSLFSEDNLTKPTQKVQELIEKNKLEIVDYKYVKKAIAKGTKDSASAVLVDARPDGKYKKGTIPSSINIPDTDYDKYKIQLNDTAKNKEIIVFCGGWACGKSPKVAGMLKKDGFTNVKLYQAGEPEWIKKSYKEVDLIVAKAIQENNSGLLVDARPYKMYLKETIPGAISIPDTNIDKLLGRFPFNKKEKIVVFCGGFKCAKSHKVANKLVAKGYKNVSVFAGGMPVWIEAGLGTTKSIAKKEETKISKKEFSANGVKIGSDEGSVDGEWFYKLYKDGKVPANIQIVDVTAPEEFAKGHLVGAINIEAEKLSAKDLYEKLPKDKSIVFNCTAGGRSLDAWNRLKQAKYDVSEVFYFDANIDCKGSDCKVKVNEPIE
ncbi:rhodanese-like domain-containing protein [Arcobacter sp.]|uniref:rhodanese-like domain-containing protein n=1 Tax=Arcobacter sp. TaxID=1872629 RepID=UPI003D0F7AA6